MYLKHLHNNFYTIINNNNNYYYTKYMNLFTSDTIFLVKYISIEILYILGAELLIDSINMYLV